MVWLDYDLDGHEDLYVANGKANTLPSPGQPNPLFHSNADPPNTTHADITTDTIPLFITRPYPSW